MQQDFAWKEQLLALSARAFDNEASCIEKLLPDTERFKHLAQEIRDTAEKYVKALREEPARASIENFLQEYKLSSKEGITVMCLSEALLRIPDSRTATDLIYDKLKAADWEKHVGKSKSLYVNASTWGMMLTGRLGQWSDLPSDGVGGVIAKLVSRLGEPVAREAIKAAMHIISGQFVLGDTIEAGIKRAKNHMDEGNMFSFDMLGEGARSTAQAQMYYQSYLNTATALGGLVEAGKPIYRQHNMSVKLSALHPRYELLQRDKVFDELYPRLHTIITKAKQLGFGITIDAEESTRFDIGLDVISALMQDKELVGYEGIGVVVQAYQKRAFGLIDLLQEWAIKYRRRIPVRLVKGAYWDNEVKQAQINGLPGYPVFTRKSNTDVSYLACASKLIDYAGHLYPQFASHNVHTVASIMTAAKGIEFEFQRLHGMGESFYNKLAERGIPCRIYAPVGPHEELLPYLIRRLLENGANTSFVYQLLDESQSVDALLTHPLDKVNQHRGNPNPTIPAPLSLYPDRRNSRGYDYGNMSHMQHITGELKARLDTHWIARPLASNVTLSGGAQEVHNPAQHDKVIGSTIMVSRDEADVFIAMAEKAFGDWRHSPVSYRFQCIERAAKMLEKRRYEAIALLVKEAGKTLKDAVAEVREAEDFCRYYAAQARKFMERPHELPGPTGERNQLSLHGKGVFVCISPWNFPLAIFTGQIVAALLTGNSVIAKPAQQTTLMAHWMCQLLHAAGVPKDVLLLAPGDGSTVGAALVADPRIAGVAFTGSTTVATSINTALATRHAPIGTLIAETGGQNCMVVDSSALLEQVADDVLVSAFGSAGQRCSALRVLYVQEDIAGKLLELLTGAMHALHVGDPALLTTDIGPVIDARAKASLQAHISAHQGQVLAQYTLDEERTSGGHFVAPTIIGLKSMKELTEEQFGPVLHIIRYKSSALEEVVDEINSTGYGLTFGVHSRIEERIQYLTQHVRAGNIYVNRSMIGAVVGVQPFGGEGLSGTGPKAGGPNYLFRFMHERCISTNTTAIGGNLALLT